MGHKHSTLHRQLKHQDTPNRDLVTSLDSGGGGPHVVTANSSNSSTTSPYFDVKKGPFRRRLSMRNISIRRSFHISKKSHSRLNNKVSATTDDIGRPSTSSADGSNAVLPLPVSASTSTSLPPNGTTIPSEHKTSISSTNNTPPPISLPKSLSTNRNGDKLVMDRLRKSFRNSFRRKREHVPESIKPHQWQSDELAVKMGNCMFAVKYLGCVEVFDSRGMQICEDALRRLRNSRRRPIKGTLYVTGDGLRVVDDQTKGLIVDQTIEKVSFCAPDRSHERGFSYICRDGTTRRWMCHGFHATKDSGERLSHAVGCAFAVCLERKQRRDKEAVSSIFDQSTATFTRTGSFRASSITERMQDPQVSKPAEPVPVKPVHNPYAVERPHATPSLLQRQGSLRGGPLNHASPFKRQLSLRLGVDSLPPSKNLASTNNCNSSISTENNHRERERAHSLDLTATLEQSSSGNGSAKRPVLGNLFPFNSKVTLAPSVAPIEEVSPSSISPAVQPDESSIITAMCKELSKGLTMLSAKSEEHNAQTISAFDQWLSSESNSASQTKSNEPMPQVAAPPPPSSPPAFTANFNSNSQSSETTPRRQQKSSDYHSSLFSDLTSSLKENLVKTAAVCNQSPSVLTSVVSNSIKTNGEVSSLSCKSSSIREGSTNNNSPLATTNGIKTHKELKDDSTADPFDAGWVELTNRHLFDIQTTTAASASAAESTSLCSSHSSTSNASSNIVSANIYRDGSPAGPMPPIPFKSTNPFLDISHFHSDTSDSRQAAEATTTVVNSTQSTQPASQMFKAFEVHM